jgi:Glycosyl hydrolase family 26
MRSRLVLLVAVVLAAASVVFAVTRIASSAPSSPPVAHASLPPRSASYLGVFAAGSPPSYAPIASFAQAAGRQPNLVGYYSGWAEPFATSFAEKVRSHGVIPFVQIDPMFASISAIAAGDYDGYLRSYAQSVRKFGHAVVIGFGHEMNAPWYPWGYKHVSPKTFVAAWRHIVTLFRHQGADNVTWLWTINQDRSDTRPVASWWPGSSYVTWVGIDGYYYRPSDTFANVFGTTIDQVRAFTHKPILLSETAVGPDANQFVGISDLFHGMSKYGTLGLVWFDKAQHGGIFHQDWRLEGSTTAQAAFRLGLSALTLARP